MFACLVRGLRLPPVNGASNALGRVCLSVCLFVCPVRALTSESLDLQTSFLLRGYDFRISRSSSYIKVIGSRSPAQKRSRDRNSRVVRFRSVERRSCFPLHPHILSSEIMIIILKTY